MSSSNKFADAVSRMVRRTNLEEEAGARKHPSHHQQGPLTPQELAELSFLCTAASNTSNNNISDSTAAAAAANSNDTTTATNSSSSHAAAGFASVEGDDLVALVQLLDRHVNLAVGVHLIDDALQSVYQSDAAPSVMAAAFDKWFKHGPGKDKLAALRGGLEAAAIILFIANTAHVDRRAMNEDAIEVSITLLRLHLAKHLLPALNNTAAFVNNNKNGGDNGAIPLTQSPHKKRRRGSGSAAATAGSVEGKELKKVYKHIVGTINLQLVLMERLESLVQSLPLEDQQVLMLTNGCLPAFEIDTPVAASSSKTTSTAAAATPGQQLQLAAIQILTAAFAKYPAHRDIVLEDLFPVMLNLPSGKRSLRVFPVRYASAAAPEKLRELNSQLVVPLLTNTNNNNNNNHCIQMMTALILSLVQACVVRPSYQVVDNANDDNNNNNNGCRLQSGLGSCVSVAESLVAQLLKRCTRTKGGHVSEYRPILQNFVEDLLLVLLVPEYPAAEMILSSLQRRLNHDLTMASPVFKTATVASEATYLNTAFDAMGKICAVQARILAGARDKPLTMTTDIPMSDCSDFDDVNCHCKKKMEDCLLINCDHCKTTYHGPCVGIQQADEAPDEWLCDSCVLAKIVGRELRNCKDEEGYLDQYYAMHHSFQSVTAHRLGVDMEDAVHFQLARWIDELEYKGLNDDSMQRRPRKIVARLLEHWDVPGPAAEPLTEEGSDRIILALMANTSPFFLAFRKQIGFILKIMADESTHNLRKLSLKAIEKTVEGDPNLMLLPVVNRAVSRRLSDSNISVRDKAVSLVGAYVVKSPQLASAFHSSLLPCLMDPGVSVRKRAVQIFQQILVKNPRYRGRSAVCNVMLQRFGDPKEEDSVHDLIEELFCELWLRDGDEEIASSESSNDSCTDPSGQVGESVPGVVTPNSPPFPSSSKRKGPQRRSDVAAEQMMEVIQAGNTGDHLEALLKKLLSGGGNSESTRKKAERKKRQQLGKTQCTQLVNSLFELLLVVEEQRDIRATVGKDIASTLTAIAVFANVSPHPILTKLDALLPYLKADNNCSMEDESAIVSSTCEIIARLSPVFDRPTLDRLAASSIAKDMSQISYKFGTVALSSAIRAFSSLAHHPETDTNGVFSKKLLALAKVFYSYLCKKNTIDDFSTTEEKLKNSVHRALTVLGLICENHRISVDASTWGDEVESDDTPLLSDEELTWENSTLACYRLFSKYLAKNDSPTKCKALAALKGIFVAQPQLLLQLDHVGLFDDVMADSAGAAVNLEALECWRSILTAEERRIDSGQADAKMNADGSITVSKRISGDQDGDATLFGGVLTSHAERLYEMTHATNPDIRFSTLNLIGLLLRQGLLNPNEAVPHLFSLQGDIENNTVRSLALQLLMNEGEKRADTLRQRICAGVKQAYKFQRAIYPTKSEVSAVVTTKRGEILEVESIFNSVFKECIVKNKKQRLGLYKTLLGLWSFDLDDEETVSSSRRKSKSRGDSSKDLSLLSFAAQILAHLPYNTTSDPLYIIHHITTVLTLQGYQTLDRLAAFLRPYGLASSDEDDEANATEDALDRAAKNKFPSRSHEAKPLSSKDFDMPGFVDLCREGAALTLLLRLKNFLRENYNLSRSRCAQYDPSAKERLCEKGITAPKISTPFDSSVPAVLRLKKEGPVDKDALIRQYAEFRAMMRDENAITTSSSSDDAGDEEEEEEEEDHEEAEQTVLPRKRSASAAEEDSI